MCPACGAGARDGARYCLNCGAHLDPEDPHDSTAEGHQPPAEEAATERIAPAEADQGPVEEETADLTDCPNCGAPNSARRQRCGRCGADLATGEPPRTARPEPTPAPAPRSRASRRAGPEVDTGPLAVRRRRGRVAWIIVGIAVIAGAALGALAAAEVGPFAEEPPAPQAATFDPAVYEGQPRPLEVAAVLASSTHEPRGAIRYDASLMIDGLLDTAWNNVGSARPEGVGETLRFELEQPAWISGLVIANGYQKDDRTFVDNARVQRVRLWLGGEAVYDVSVLDRTGRQVVTLPEPVLAEQVTLEVLETYPGATYEDVAVSELELRGWPAVGEDAERFAAEPTSGAG